MLHENGHECSLDQPCGNTRCSVTQAAEVRAVAQQDQWSELKVVHEHGGPRHYLDGYGIHCGETIALQQVEERYDDHGEYIAPTQRWQNVRYEASTRGKEIYATLHVNIGGYEFVASLKPWMRFRR